MKIIFENICDDQETIHLDFTYVHDVTINNHGKKGIATVCTISAPGFQHISGGCSICSPNDVFSRTIGRKNALAHAFEDGFFSKEEKHRIWKEYFSITNKNVKIKTKDNDTESENS